MLKDASAAPGFVAAFSQSSVGDTTPNVLGAWCDDGSGTQCTLDKSTCGGTSQACHGRGPAFQKLDLGVSSCYEIGRRVYAGAKSLYVSSDRRISARQMRTNNSRTLLIVSLRPLQIRV
jgi:neutral ceramidase